MKAQMSRNIDGFRVDTHFWKKYMFREPFFVERWFEVSVEGNESTDVEYLSVNLHAKSDIVYYESGASKSQDEIVQTKLLSGCIYFLSEVTIELPCPET